MSTVSSRQRSCSRHVYELSRHVAPISETPSGPGKASGNMVRTVAVNGMVAHRLAGGVGWRQAGRAGRELRIANVTYKIVEHDGGWAYTVEGSFSETFPNHDAALHAARRAAAEQRVGDEDRAISYETPDGIWHTEQSSGGNRPTTEVEG